VVVPAQAPEFLLVMRVKNRISWKYNGRARTNCHTKQQFATGILGVVHDESVFVVVSAEFVEFCRGDPRFGGLFAV